MKKIESVLSIESNFSDNTSRSNLSIETSSLPTSISMTSMASESEIILQRALPSDVSLNWFDNPITTRDLLLRKKYQKGRYAYSPETIQDTTPTASITTNSNETPSLIHIENASDYWQSPRTKSPSPSKYIALLRQTEILIKSLDK